MIDSEVETIGVMRSCADSTEQRARRTGDCHRSVAVADSFWASMGSIDDQPDHADDLDHGKRGAYGQWSRINEDNSTTDEVSMEQCLKPWNGGGSYTWPIPNAWRVAGDGVSTNVFVHTDQRFELDADGTARVSKFGWTGERGTNDTHRVYEGDR